MVYKLRYEKKDHRDSGTEILGTKETKEILLFKISSLVS